MTNTASNILVKELSLSDVHPGLLADFDRTQEVRRRWRRDGGQWVLKDAQYTAQWGAGRKDEIIGSFRWCLEHGGSLIGAYEGEMLAGFAIVGRDLFGSERQYAPLGLLHVTRERRGCGIGKRLFRAATEKARSFGAKKLYISASTAEETKAFYAAMGCVDAAEVNQETAEHAPDDRQMECVL